MNKFLLIIILTIASIKEVKSQSVTINSQVVFPNIKDTLNYIRFKINNQSFGEKDTIIQINVNAKGFDTCQAIIVDDTINFLTKFRESEIYEIRQGCCCAAFTLEPKNNPRRGTVTFKNTTRRDLGLIIAEANIDTVKTNKTQTTFSYESAMCLFKPCSILITEILYFSDSYNYKNDKRDYEILWKEQTKYILTKSWFQFLHGEKIELEYNDKIKETKIKLIGYMTDNEYENIWK
jgi:hypothetical protein